MDGMVRIKYSMYIRVLQVTILDIWTCKHACWVLPSGPSNNDHLIALKIAAIIFASSIMALHSIRWLGIESPSPATSLPRFMMHTHNL